MTDDNIIAPFSVVKGSGYNANQREIFYCTGCQCRTFKLVKYDEDDIRVQCSNCEDWMMGMEVTAK